MARTEKSANIEPAPSREALIAALNEDLAREYQAIISYVVYSQVLKGAEYMNIAAELEKHAQEELSHALHYCQASGLPRRNARNSSEGSSDFGKSEGHAPL
jgi:hypothetical protein